MEVSEYSCIHVQQDLIPRCYGRESDISRMLLAGREDIYRYVNEERISIEEPGTRIMYYFVYSFHIGLEL